MPSRTSTAANGDRACHSPPRLRARTTVALAAVVGAALASRRWPLPGMFAEHTGDALYTCAVLCCLALLRPGAASAMLALGALLVSAAVELTQLLQWQWLVELRANRLAALVLGQGFQVADLFAYLAGAAAAGIADRALRRSDRTQRP